MSRQSASRTMPHQPARSSRLRIPVAPPVNSWMTDRQHPAPTPVTSTWGGISQRRPTSPALSTTATSASSLPRQAPAPAPQLPASRPLMLGLLPPLPPQLPACLTQPLLLPLQSPAPGPLALPGPLLAPLLPLTAAAPRQAPGTLNPESQLGWKEGHDVESETRETNRMNRRKKMEPETFKTTSSALSSSRSISSTITTKSWPAWF